MRKLLVADKGPLKKSRRVGGRLFYSLFGSLPVLSGILLSISYVCHVFYYQAVMSVMYFIAIQLYASTVMFEAFMAVLPA